MNSTKKRVRNLIYVIGSGILFAVAITAFMLYKYNPSGRYLLSNTLLSPETIPQMSYNAYDPKTNGTSRFVFDKIEFSYFDFKNNQWISRTDSIINYGKFYQLVRSEKSVLNPSKEIIALFNQKPPATITLKVHTESPAQWQATTKNFQEVQFANEGDYFRIQLHDQSAHTQWVYFYYPHIYYEIMQLFNSGSK